MQGFPVNRYDLPKAVSLNKFRGMIGNAYSVNVAGRVMLQLLKTIGVVDAGHVDVWEEYAKGLLSLDPVH